MARLCLVCLVGIFFQLAITSCSSQKSPFHETKDSSAIESKDTPSEESKSHGTVNTKTANVRLPFVKNVGQLPDNYRYYTDTFAGRVYVLDGALKYFLLNKINEKIVKTSIAERFVGTKPQTPEAILPATTKVNYFLGAQESWKTNVPTFDYLLFTEVWPGIDAKLSASSRNIEKIFSVKPNADVSQIKLKIEGAKNLKILEDGRLEIQTALGSLTMSAPVAFQMIEGKKKNVTVAYQVSGLEYSFQVDSYNKNQELIIDPLIASTYLGGVGLDFSQGLGRNAAGEYFLYGETESADLPSTMGAVDTSINGGRDVFVAKFSQDLSTLLALTYLGGSGFDTAAGITVTANSGVFIYGSTGSLAFPLTMGVYDTTFLTSEGFISYLSDDLSTLNASTLLGGTGTDYVTSIVEISGGNIVVCGSTNSSDFPLPGIGYDLTHNGNFDVFIMRLNFDLNTSFVGTYVGGTDLDDCSTVAVNDSGTVYAYGKSDSSDFPTTVGTYDTSYNGNTDAIVVSLSSDLQTLNASTYIGGSNREFPRFMLVDAGNKIIITGDTESNDYPTQVGAFDTTHNGFSDIYATRLSADLSNALNSTLVGGADVDGTEGSAALDSNGNLILGGSHNSSNFPLTSGAYINTNSTRTDGHLIKLDPNFSQLISSTGFRGTNNDVYINGVFVDSNDYVTFIGRTGSSDIPVSATAYDQSFAGDRDAFIARLGSTLAQTASIINVSSTNSNVVYTAGDTITITLRFSDPVSVTGSPLLTLETGTLDASAIFTSASGNTVEFNYSVQLGHQTLDLEYLSTTALSLNGGSILDPEGNPVGLTLPTPAATGSLSANKTIQIEAIDTDGDGTPDLTDSDDDNDGISDAIEAFLGTNPVVSDTDGGGVNDGQELADNTNPLDRGSELDRLPTTLCGEWNGFLDLLNVLEHVNMRGTAMDVNSMLYSITGAAQSSITFPISAGAQFDLLVHDMMGRVPDSYGRVCSMVQGVASAGDLDGRMVYYRRNPANLSTYQFAFALPLQNPRRNSVFVPFNTFQPSLDFLDQGNLVANYVQISNEETSTQTGSLIVYGQLGEVIRTSSVTLGARARQDIAVHDVGSTLVGTVEWRPDNTSALFQVRNVRYIYDNPGSVNSFYSAYQLEAVAGSGQMLAVPLETSGMSAILEISNVLSSAQDVDLRIYNAAGTQISQQTLNLAANESRHIITDSLLLGGQGVATIDGSSVGGIVAVAMHYGRNARQGINFMYGIRAQEALGTVLRGSYNTFLGQGCHLLIVNSSSSPVTANISMVRYDGTNVLSGDMETVPPKGIIDYDLCSIEQPERYGVVTVQSSSPNSLLATVIRRAGTGSTYRFPTPVRE